ncbi:urea transporter [Streptomyces sp. JB150]|uniref:urea transporter n=1 Tax=Streptomyces sp. JB150 TaxID=2714844 RepID=UPI001408171D|nr:urea transporter [Streptomyces sp. JB150]QIJ66087.1 urea transporter [Streptomyces sp. JB150]
MRRSVRTRRRDRRWSAERGPGFAAQVLRGLAQVMFLARPWAGAVVCLALCAADWRYAVYAAGGAALGTGTARALGVARDRPTPGLEGVNPALVALCCAALLSPDRPATALLAAAGSVVGAVLTAAAARVLRVWGLPPLTLPYCVLAVAISAAAPAFARVRPYGDGLAALPGAASGPAAPRPEELLPQDLARAFLHNVSQVFFLAHWQAGALLLAALFLASRTAGLAACAGSAAGIATAWALGAPAERIADGTMGCNAVLVALALCGVFLPATAVTLLYALLGAATATLLTPAVAVLLAPSGGHAFTWPFVLTTLVFLAAARSFPRLTAPAPVPGTDPPAWRSRRTCRESSVPAGR